MADQDKLREFPLLIRVRDQTGGLNTRSFGTEIADNEAQILKNVFGDPGLLKKRGGSDTFATAASGVSGATRGMAKFRPDQGSAQVLLYSIEDKIYSVDSSGVTSLRATTATSDLEGEFTQGLNKIFFCNGTDDPLVFDTSLGFSTIASGSTTLPKHTTADYFLGMIFSNDVSNKSHVDISTSLSDLFSNPARTLKLGEGSGNSEVVRLQGYRNREMLVFMNNRIEEIIVGSDLTDVTTWDIKVIDERYGLIAKDTVKEVGGMIFFLDNELRVRVLNRTALDAPMGTQAIPISDKVEADFNRINKLHISKCSAAVHENLYMISMPLDSATENDTTYVFDLTRKAWYGPWTLSAGKFVESDIRGQGYDTYLGHSATGDLIRMFDGSFDDDEASIPTDVTTKKYDGGRPESDKIFNEIEVAVLGTGDGTVNVAARVDAAGFTNIGSFSITGGGAQLPIPLPFPLGSSGIAREKFHLEGMSRGRNIDFKFTHDETTDVQYNEWIVTMQDANYERENI
jgi:hypothetical protein